MQAKSVKRAIGLAGLMLALAAGGGAEVKPLRNGAGPADWKGDLSSIAASDWSYERAAHLLERAGFGGTPEAIEKLAAMTPSQAVDSLVDYESNDTSHLPAFVESGIWDEAMFPDVDEYMPFSSALGKARRTGGVYGARPNNSDVRPYQPIINALYYRNYATRHEWNRAVNWWANRMLVSPRQLEEKMTLFWHGHFSAEQEKVRDYRLMLDQIAMLRANATGGFRNLLIGIAKDPAMLIYLDNRENVKGHANENFAREIMELFALGVGNYTEDDVKEAARAFTGWASYGRNFVIKPELHDETTKTLLGKTGNFDGEDVIDILLAQEVAAEFISRKIYRFLVRGDVSEALNRRLAGTLRAGGYEIKPLLKQIFLSKDFYSPASYGAHIKSPTEFLISGYRKLGLTELPGTPRFDVAMNRLGQNLGNPPNVAGWDGGRAWINPSTLLERGNIMRHLLFPELAGDIYYLGPFTARYQRYKNAPSESAARDRDVAMGAGAAGGAPEMMGEGATMLEKGGPLKMAPSATMINETPQYDLPLGVYNGMNKAFSRVLPTPTTSASLDLTAMARAAGVETPDDAVRYFERRFLRLPLDDADRKAMTRFVKEEFGGTRVDLDAASSERILRELLHLIMSAPEYQLS